MTEGIKRKISGWGHYPVQEGYVYRPETERDVRDLLLSGKQRNYIPYGLGRSYGDTPLNENEGIVLTHQLNRFISFDKGSGILLCEGGVTLADIIETFLPRGFFLPVTPGTKYVTVAGAIANDVHGKNHHVDGTFSNFVIQFDLLVASGELVTCSREENTDLFWATIGGIGLTGIIVTAAFRLIKVDTAFYNVRHMKAPNIDAALRLFSDSDKAFQYSVAWIDCLSRGKSLGRSVLMQANHAMLADIKQKQPLEIKEKLKLGIPFNLPAFTLNNMSITVFNHFYYHIHKNVNKLVDYDSFFYPLDSILNWNRLYGKKGFVQYQAVFPKEGIQGIVQMLERLSSAKRTSFLAVLKSSGEQGEGLLSFPTKGYTLAVDIPIKDESLFPFLQDLNDLVVKYGGRVYLAKDSVLSRDHFVQMYPRLNRFKEIINQIDPNHVFSSSMGLRLGIVEE